jgi:ribonuclease J
MTDLRVIPLGGLGEIGMNCLALEQRGDIIVVDCGVTFPNADNGVDVIHPRFDYLFDNHERVRGVVITHGHEDHIGALPYLLDELDVPVWAPAHAMALIRARLDEWRFDLDALRLHETRVGEPFSVGSFEIEPIRVTPSIADATALAIRTDAGVVIHTGDFKLDPRPSDGELTDEARLAALGDAGVRLLFSDSTNVDSPGTATSETDVGVALGEVVAAAAGRVVIGMFSSNVQRLLEVGAIARRSKRNIALLGRSVMNHVRAATAVGRLDWPSNLLVSPDVAQNMPRRDVLVIASGTQAEPVAALARLANGTHPRLRLDPGDTVIMSSRIIPGNDRPVFDMFGDFLRQDVELVSRVTHPRIHASGHAHRDEQRRMIELVRPQAFIPVHGTLHHLKRHAALASSLGVADVLVIENGQVVRVGTEGPPEKAEKVRVGRVATFDGASLADDVLRERAQLGRVGVLTVAFALSPGGRLAGSAELGCLGVLAELDRDVLARAQRAVEVAVDGARGGPDDVANAAKLAARKVVETHTGQKPQVIVSILRGAPP